MARPTGNGWSAPQGSEPKWVCWIRNGDELHMGMELYNIRSDRREDQLAPESYMGQNKMIG